MAWRELTRQKREQIASLMPLEWRLDTSVLPSRTSQYNVINFVPKFLSSLEQEITGLSVPHLLESLRSGRYTAREVVAAFCHRAALAHQLGSHHKLPLPHCCASKQFRLTASTDAVPE